MNGAYLAKTIHLSRMRAGGAAAIAVWLISVQPVGALPFDLLKFNCGNCMPNAAVCSTALAKESATVAIAADPHRIKTLNSACQEGGGDELKTSLPIPSL